MTIDVGFGGAFIHRILKCAPHFRTQMIYYLFNFHTRHRTAPAIWGCLMKPMVPVAIKAAWNIALAAPTVAVSNSHRGYPDNRLGNFISESAGNKVIEQKVDEPISLLVA